MTSFRLDKFSKDEARAILLENGTVFTINNLTLEFEDSLFYEVKFNGYDEFMQTLWERTGKVFNIKEVNKYKYTKDEEQ